MDEPFETPDGPAHSASSLLFGIGLGALLGVAAAILLAPQSGSDTRQDLSDLSGKVKDRADEMINELKQNLDELNQKSRELVDTAKDRVEAALQAGREAADEKRQELEAQVHGEEAV
jgi:gas vesicle protein